MIEDWGVACRLHGDGIVWLGWAGLPRGPASPVGSFRVHGPAVLINQRQPFISSSHFLFTLWGGASPRGQRLRRDDQLSPSPTVTGIVSARSLAEHMTDIWMAGSILRHRCRYPEESSTFTPSPTSSLSLCFDSFICKSRDKTYGANLQQINGDPGWLSTLDIRSERCDTPNTCLCLKLCLIH